MQPLLLDSMTKSKDGFLGVRRGLLCSFSQLLHSWITKEPAPKVLIIVTPSLWFLKGCKHFFFINHDNNTLEITGMNSVSINTFFSVWVSSLWMQFIQNQQETKNWIIVKNWLNGFRLCSCRCLTALWAACAPGRAQRCLLLPSPPASSGFSCPQRIRSRWETRGGWFLASSTSLLGTCPTIVTTLPPRRAKRYLKGSALFGVWLRLVIVY